jgi:hypothetical protein
MLGLSISPFGRALEGLSIAPGYVDPRITWTRAQAGGARSTAFRGGLWREFGPDVPRFTDFGVLVGGQRTNLVADTRNYPSWINNNITVSATAGPDGVADSAAQITETLVTGGHSVSSTFSGIVAGAYYTQSAYFRAAGNGARYMQISGSNALGVTFYANFDLLDGLVTAAVDCVAQIANVGDGWFLSSVTLVAPSGGNGTFRFSSADLPNAPRLASHAGTGKIYHVAWPQVEEGLFASTAILPAVGTPAASTRGADLPTAALASLGIGANGACTVLFTAIIPTASSAAQTILTLDDGTGNNRFRVFTVAGGFSLNVGRTLAGAGASNTIATAPANTPFAVGVVINGAGRIAGVLGGGSVVQQLGGPTNGLTTMRLGADASGIGNLFGEIGHLQILPYAVSDTELQARMAALPLT